jgi:hypothetical protein
LVFVSLEKQQHAAQATATSFQNLFEAEAGQTQLLQGAITSVCDILGVEPDADTEEDAPGNSFVYRMAALGHLVREKIRGGLHHGMKRAMAVVQSRFEYDMGLIANGFIMDPDRIDEENEAACLDLIEAAEEPGVALRSYSRLRWSRLPTMRACKPNMGMKACVIG